MAQLSTKYLALKAKRDAKRKAATTAVDTVSATATPNQSIIQAAKKKRETLIASQRTKKLSATTGTTTDTTAATTTVAGGTTGTTETAPTTTTATETPSTATTDVQTPETAGTTTPVGTDTGSQALTAAEQNLETGATQQVTIAGEDKAAAVDLANQQYENTQADLQAQQDYLDEITARREATITTGAEDQKAQADADYASQQAAIALAQKKSDEAYQKAQDQQTLYNAQRKIRDETRMGLIGGFGSAAGLQNIEDNIMQGEQKVIDLQTESADADTAYANQLTDLTASYHADKQKIDQWKSTEIDNIYDQLEQYTMQIMSDTRTAAMQKSTLIAQAVSTYNNRVGEINMQVLSARSTLSQALVTRSDTLRQEAFSNKIQTAQLSMQEEQFSMQKQTAALEKLQNLMNTSGGKLYANFTGAARKQLDQLAEESGYGKDFVIKYLKAQKDAQEATTAQAQLALEKQVLDLQLQVPKGQTFTFGGQTYTGMKKITGGGGGGGSSMNLDKVLSLSDIKSLTDLYGENTVNQLGIVPGVTTMRDISSSIQASQAGGEDAVLESAKSSLQDDFNSGRSYEDVYTEITSDTGLIPEQQQILIGYLNEIYGVSGDQEGYFSGIGGWLSNALAFGGTGGSPYAPSPYEEPQRDISEIPTTLSMPK